MTARATARRLVLQAAFVLPGAAGVSVLSPACYSSGAGGTDPPTTTFYFPVGLAVSAGGNVLYVANSDFDLQWNGGTIQSYDLFRLRHDTAELIGANFLTPSPTDPSSFLTIDGRSIPFSTVTSMLNGGPSGQDGIRFLTGQGLDDVKAWAPNCQDSPGTFQPNGNRLPFGLACSPPVDSTAYIGSSAIIGAFATDVQLSLDGTRLYVPVRGNATLTWADVLPDQATSIPPDEPGQPGKADAGSPGANWPPPAPTGNNIGDPHDRFYYTPDPFHFYCGAGDRCDADHQTGPVPTALDTRDVTLPGEPFAMAQTEDGTAVAVTHQSSPQTSVLETGLPACLDKGSAPAPACVPAAGLMTADPSMQFVLTGVPVGGDGMVAVPHDLDSSIPRCELVGYQTPCVRPAFLETTHSAAELDLLRYYNDDGSSLLRPFLVREVAYTLTVNSGGTDSRGIAIDDTPRRACKALPGANVTQCAQLPARVFFASRTPPSLVLAEIGEYNDDGSYNPDQLKFNGNVPLQAGASKVYLAPIVDGSGHYALRVFVVCFDSNEIFVYDPDAGMIENVINTGPGPFAMAFDPFSLDDVAQRKLVPGDSRQQDAYLKSKTGIDISSSANGPASLKSYRFAYVASFTNSYVQVIDLDDSVVEPCPGASNESCNVTFEHPVFTLGQPTVPKGS
jgi:hypothetical protein